MKRNNMYIFLLSLFFSPALHAVIVGSNESVSIQSHINFPAADADNSILGFAWMKNGFTLQDASTTCTFNSLYPFSGVFGLNGGTLVLQQDLVFKDVIQFQSLGTIIGNGHSFDLTHGVLTPISALIFDAIYQDVTIYLSDQVNFNVLHNVIFRGNCSMIGSSSSFFNLQNAGALIVDSNSSVTFKNLTLHGVQGNNLRCVDDSGKIILQNSSITQTDDYAFSTGSLSFLGNVDWQGSFTFLYDSMQSATIQSESTLNITGGLTFFTGRVADGAAEPLIFTDQSSILNINGALLHINEHGARFTKGTFETTGMATLDIDSTSTATGLEFGDGTAPNDIQFQFNNGSSTNFNSGMVVFNVTTFDIPSLQGNNVKVQQGDTSILYFAQNYNVNNIILDLSLSSQQIIAPGKQLLFTNVTNLTENGGSYVVTGFFQVGVGFLLTGNQSMDIVSGSLDVALLIENAGNILTGAGNINLPIIFVDSSAELTWALTGQLQTDLILNGGTLSLAGDMSLGHIVHLVETGTVNLNNFTLNTGIIDYDRGVGFNNSIFWEGGPNSGALNFLSSLELNQTWTFSGQNLINGNGNFLDLTGGALVIEKGSLLELRNLTVEGISGDNIKCLDDQGRLILHNVTWIQNGDFMFPTGTLILQGNTSFQGTAGSVFAYQSNDPAIIRAASNISMDTGFTFSYDVSDPNLFQFTDFSSVLILNGGAVHAAQNLNLLMGSLLVEATGFMSSSVTSTITMGDCISSANDLHTTIIGGGQLNITQGSLNYKNLDASSWLLQNFFSNMLMGDGTALNLYQTMNLGDGFITFGNSILGTAPGKSLEGSVNEQGTLTFVDLPPC